MSTGTGADARTVDIGFDLRTARLSSARVLALGGIALLTGSYGTVLYHVVDVTGSPAAFLSLAAVSIGAAAVLSRLIRVYSAVIVGAVALVGGLGVYLVSLPQQPPVVPLLEDALALMAGQSLLVITNADLWALGVAPAPLFLTWYFALRRWYVTATLTGGATLGFLVLTGDASAPLVLLGVVGGTVAVGVGDVDRRGESVAVAEPLAVLLAGMILISGVASVVPAGDDQSFESVSSFQPRGSAGGGTMEASLINTGDQLDVLGSISLSPEVRFSVRSDESSYWRIGSYDRYTGDGWVRTGEPRPFSGSLEGPPGESRTITQDYTIEDDLGVVPAAWKPVAVDGPVTSDLQVTGGDGFALSGSGSLRKGDSYSVLSRSPSASPGDLRSSGRDYPEEIVERYTQVPSSTSDRVAERTARITANADNPYDTARVVEQWLERNKEYSLDVPRPRGNVADDFLFERDAGYCTYFATTMAVMLRTQGIPTRFTVGYTPGERVDSDRWVARGYDAHAWVEVYFEDQGWVRFDPTPAGPRREAEQSRLSEARVANESGVDTDETEGAGEWTPTPTPTPIPLTTRSTAAGGTPDAATPTPVGGGDGSPSTPTETSAPGAGAGGSDGSAATGGGGLLGVEVDPPTREETALGAIVLAGLVVSLRRLGLGRRVYRAFWVRYQPRSDPVVDAERAFERLEYVLERRYRPRKPSETPRQYLASIGADERTRQVALVHERARYAGRVTREEADEAIAIVDDLVSGRGTG